MLCNYIPPEILIFLQQFFFKYFSVFYMKPVARDYSLAGHFPNTLYMYYVGIPGTIFGEA
jgi:hypothetical protein